MPPPGWTLTARARTGGRSESWCRPRLRAAHCRKCKCIACRDCHVEAGARHATAGGPAAEVGAAVADGGLCLGSWRNDPLDGAPLIFGECAAPRRPAFVGGRQRSAGGGARRQQLWTLAREADDQGAFRVRTPSASDRTPLCVTVHPIYSSTQ